MNVAVEKVIGSKIAISSEIGKKLYEELNNLLREHSKIILDFEGITDLTTAFLNVGIGHLYNDFSSRELNDKLEIINLDDLDQYLLSQVIERVKLNEVQKEEFNTLIEEVIEDGRGS